jgi:hypothetical protein
MNKRFDQRIFGELIVLVAMLQEDTRGRIARVQDQVHVFPKENRPVLLPEQSMSDDGGQGGRYVPLRDGGGAGRRVEEEESSIDSPGDVPWQKFNEKAYIDKKRVKSGEDSYIRHKFNQLASETIKSNRDVPDTRHQL